MIKKIRRWWRRRKLSAEEKLFIDMLAAYEAQKRKHSVKRVHIKYVKAMMVCFLPFACMAQRRDNFLLKKATIITASFAAGWLHGTNEVSVHDYRRYAAQHPNANPQWANPRLSFRNKYKDWPHNQEPAYWGSKHVLAFTTDAYHLRSTTRNMLMAGSIGISMSLYEKPNWKKIVLQAAISWASYAAGTGAAHAFYKKID